MSAHQTVYCATDTYWSPRVLRAVTRVAAVSLLAGLGGTSVPSFAQTLSQAPAHTASFEREREVYIPATSMPKWAGSLLLQVEDRESTAPLLAVMDTGGRSERISFRLPENAYIQALRYSAGPDGSLVVTGTALSGAHQGTSFIGFVPQDRKRQTVIRTAPFVPEEVTVAADGPIWAVGTLYDDEKRRTISDNVIQRYSASGELLSSSPVLGLRSPAETPNDAAQASTLVASRERIGWFTNASQYVEFSLSGKEIGRYDGPSGPDWDPRVVGLGGGFALSAGDQAVLCTNGSSRRAFQIAVLDRQRRTWTPTPLIGGTAYQGQGLVGFDGDTLVTLSKPGVLVRWAPTGKTLTVHQTSLDGAAERVFGQAPMR